MNYKIIINFLQFNEGYFILKKLTKFIINSHPFCINSILIKLEIQAIIIYKNKKDRIV